VKLYIATNNVHKVGELKTLLQNKLPEIQVDGVNKFGGMPEVEESAGTFEGNALLKARALHQLVDEGSWTLSDDSGLIVDALNGDPGIYSARFAGLNATDDDNRKKLLHCMEGIPYPMRQARFTCTLVLLGPDDQEHAFPGTCEGSIALKEKGSDGFGYDPVFIPEGHKDTFGILPSNLKNRISHRARAFKKLVAFLNKRKTRGR
jgi:XTP/dITP diphosphohydrolase